MAAVCLVVTIVIAASPGAAEIEAELEVEDDEVAIGEPTVFDASNSAADGEILGYEWDWNEDGIYDTSTTAARVEHAFSSSDEERTVTVHLTTPYGTETARTQLAIADNQAPWAHFEVDPGSPAQNETVWLLAGESEDVDGELVAYRWDVDDDGAFELNTTEDTARVAFETSGTRSVQLQVVDDEGATATAMGMVEVTQAHAPQVDLSVEPSEIEVGEKVTVDASGTEDPDGDVVEVAFDVDGDHQPDHRAEAPGALTVSYDAAGEVEVAVSAEDDDGHTAIGTATVTVTDDREDRNESEDQQDGDLGDAKDASDDSEPGDATDGGSQDDGEQAGTTGGSGLGSPGADGDTGETSGSSGPDASPQASIEDEQLAPDGDEGPLQLVVDPGRPSPGEPVDVRVVVGDHQVEDVAWTVDGADRPAGSFLELTFEEPGEHEIAVEIHTAAGESFGVEETIVVGDGGEEASSSNASAQAQEVPGPGIGLALTVVGWAARAVRRFSRPRRRRARDAGTRGHRRARPRPR